MRDETETVETALRLRSAIAAGGQLTPAEERDLAGCEDRLAMLDGVEVVDLLAGLQARQVAATEMKRTA